MASAMNLSTYHIAAVTQHTDQVAREVTCFGCECRETCELNEVCGAGLVL
jgi:hypothetical protein